MQVTGSQNAGRLSKHVTFSTVYFKIKVLFHYTALLLY